MEPWNILPYIAHRLQMKPCSVYPFITRRLSTLQFLTLCITYRQSMKPCSQWNPILPTDCQWNPAVYEYNPLFHMNAMKTLLCFTFKAYKIKLNPTLFSPILPTDCQWNHRLHPVLRLCLPEHCRLSERCPHPHLLGRAHHTVLLTNWLTRTNH